MLVERKCHGIVDVGGLPTFGLEFVTGRRS